MRGERDAEGAHGERCEDPERDAEQPAGDALREGLTDDLADDEPLPPPERLERAELAHALVDRREGQERGEQERGRAARIERATPSRCERFEAFTSEPLIWSATSFALATCAFG